MKKVVLILLICSYSLATMGFSLKEFYCCGKLKSVTLELTPNKKQTCNKGDGGSGCCDNKYQFYKVKDNHVASKDVNNSLKYFTDLNLFTPTFQKILFSSPKIFVANRSNAPPIHSGVSTYLFNCVFRI